MDYFTKQSNKNRDRFDKIMGYYQSLNSKIIKSKMVQCNITYIIFDPCICINLKFLFDFILTDNSNNFAHSFSLKIIKLIIQEYDILQKKDLDHNQLNLENILICSKDSVPFLESENIQLKFFNFQDAETKHPNDEQQIFNIIKEFLKMIELENFEKNLRECKDLKEIKKIVNNITINKELKIFQLIHPSRLEYIYKVNELFKTKLLKNNDVEFVEQLIKQHYYYDSLKKQYQDYELYSILKKIDKQVKMYQVAQQNLYNQLTYEIRFLNQLYQSFFMENKGEKIINENIQKVQGEKMKINFQYEFYQILKNTFQDPNYEENFMKLEIQNKFEYIWKYQNMILKQYYLQGTDLIISSLQRLADNNKVKNQI